MKLNSPIFCDINITENCMFKCKMCRLWQTPKNPHELSIEDWKAFIVSLEEFGSSHIRLHFAGGEPLVKDGILDLIAFANNKGFPTVMVTNGFLIDEAMAEKIVRSGLDVISISLDSLNADTHDFLRGIKGAHGQVLQAIDYLNSQGAKGISILAVIMGPNLDDLTRLAEWVNDNNSLSSIYFQAISHPIAMPKDKKWRENSELAYLWPKDKVRLNNIIDGLIHRKNNGYKISNSIRQLEAFKAYFEHPDRLDENMICNQGDYVAYVQSTGDVLLCGHMSPIGNIKENNIKTLWDSEKADLRRKEIRSCKDTCLNVINCFENKDLL